MTSWACGVCTLSTRITSLTKTQNLLIRLASNTVYISISIPGKLANKLHCAQEALPQQGGHTDPRHLRLQLGEKGEEVRPGPHVHVRVFLGAKRSRHVLRPRGGTARTRPQVRGIRHLTKETRLRGPLPAKTLHVL